MQPVDVRLGQARLAQGNVSERRHPAIIASAAWWNGTSGSVAPCPEGNPSHGGAHAVAAARRHGVQTMFTLSGGHVFPLYDGAVKADPPMRIVDVGTSRPRCSRPRPRPGSR